MSDNAELKALIKLLEDPDPEIFRLIKERILQYGEAGKEALENHLALCSDHLVQQRIGTIEHELHYGQLVEQFEKWLQNNEADLLAGLCIITSYKHPKFNPDIFKEGVRAIKKDIWEGFGSNLSPSNAATALNKIYFDRYGFEVQHNAKLEESDLYLHETLSERMGSLTSIGMLYAAIAAELNLPIYPVSVPKGGFLLGYMHQEYDSTRDFRNYPIDSHFFIDPSSYGTTYPRTEAYQKFVKTVDKNAFGDCLFPLSNPEAIQLILEEKATFYQEHDKEQHYEELTNLIRISTEHIERKTSSH